ncbi:haloacid dehalogenase type II [Jannaschia aquimarina]|uniref:(S)-2-haloacid dehalogenase n=1 Tax=Jannaschia aquimarina TaxID=935700 RepID=A0A0D1D686_9RHOB|nr:haloacid dehalogenase type II [Jannaschia aquimarina]KIT15513.1 (S)-2-haloacid dehalogenase 4A [Jannaschia aquimarina]SNT34344.1 2-haloacid dehalogenase [Jannaschia aquimarina]
MAITTCIFDAYGTLFDVGAAARQAAAEDGFEALAEIWPKLAADWRDKQLQYTWLRAVTGTHTDFWQVTGDGLDWALDASGLDDPAMRERLMQLYWELSPYPEVPEVLGALKDKKKATGILSNGTPEMLSAAVKYAGIARLLDHVLSVESVGVFKPAKAVYDMVGRTFDVPTDEVMFVSANGWDAAAAADYGFTTVWVNRTDAPMDRLPGTPSHILTDLAALPDLVADA